MSRRARQNAGEGADWGPDGEAAFEMEMAVRDALAEADPLVARRLREYQGAAQAVRSAYSPAARSFVVEVHGDLPGRPPRPIVETTSSQVVLVDSTPLFSMGADDETLDAAVAILNRDWPIRDYEWSWRLYVELPMKDRVIHQTRNIYAISLDPIREFAVIRIDQDNDDTYAARIDTEGGQALGDAIIDALELAKPDSMARIEFTSVRAKDAGDARMAARHVHRRLHPWERFYQEYGRENPPRMYRPQRVVAQLQRDARPSFTQKGMVLTQPEDVAYALAEYMGLRATEFFVVLFINVKNAVIGYTEFSSGSVASVSVDVSGAFRDALLSGAAAIITVHNHPTGNAEPSSDDFELWERFRAAGKLIGIPVIDNMVLGESEYYSQSQESASPIPRDLMRSRSAAEGRK